VSKTKYQKSVEVRLGQKSYGYVKNNNFWKNVKKIITWKHRHMTYQIKAFEKTSTMAIKLNYKKLTLLKYDHVNDETTII